MRFDPGGSEHDMATTFDAPAPTSMPDTRWRTRDIVMAAVIGVAFGVVFWAWGLVWNGPLAVLSTLALPVRDLGYAVWLIPAVLAPLIIRKPGAAIFAEMVAAGLSALLGTRVGSRDPARPGSSRAPRRRSSSGSRCIGSGPSRSWRSRPLRAPRRRGSTTGSSTTRRSDPTIQVIRLVFMAISAVVIVAGGSVALHRSLKRAGVLEGFPD